MCLGLRWGLWRFTAGPGHNQACWWRWWTASFNRFYEFTAGLPLLLAFISLSLETTNASKLISSRRADRQTGRQSPRIPVCVHIPPCAHTCTLDSPCAPGVWGSADRGKMKSLCKQHVAMHFYGIPSQHPETAVGPVPVAMAIRARPSQPNNGAVCVWNTHTNAEPTKSTQNALKCSLPSQISFICTIWNFCAWEVLKAIISRSYCSSKL